MSGDEKAPTMIGLKCWNCESKDEYPAGSTSPCTNDCGWKVSIRADDLYACWIEIVPGLTAPTPDDTAAPDHYKARHFAIGVQAGAELIDWIVAMRGKEFAINAMIFEIQTKANRLGLGARADHIIEDCFKIRQACRVVERLEGQQ